MSCHRAKASWPGPGDWETPCYHHVVAAGLMASHGRNPRSRAREPLRHRYSNGTSVRSRRPSWSSPGVGGVVEVRSGDVVFTPAGEEHWHGARHVHFVAQMSITEGPARWGAHVTDAEYQPPTSG